ncbi:hypothetical protein Vse01_09840 [Micromonospora sediminimaris]|uniref:Uncharacterized protein n=1 Tax=Micromonospora sediminimaris TaxID=547162 RepID=A0A9W5XI29_9ACTN|nr:hypothetical protein Vse01_09840 [Micromonospora sediminimaris]
MVQPAQRAEAVGDHRVRASAVQVRHEGHAARVMLVRGVMEAGRGRYLAFSRRRLGAVWVRKGHRASCRRSGWIMVGTTSALYRTIESTLGPGTQGQCRLITPSKVWDM